jgi:hypothetical protein
VGARRRHAAPAAYKLLAAYDNNQAGQLAAVTGDHHGLERRELGDPSKLIDTTLGYLLGAEQTIVAPGAGASSSSNSPRCWRWTPVNRMGQGHPE